MYIISKSCNNKVDIITALLYIKKLRLKKVHTDIYTTKDDNYREVINVTYSTKYK